MVLGDDSHLKAEDIMHTFAGMLDLHPHSFRLQRDDYSRRKNSQDAFLHHL